MDSVQHKDTNATNDEARDSYAARKPGWPGYVAIVADDPRWRKETAKDIADFVKSGYEVERVTRSQAVAGLREFEAERKRRAAEPGQANLPQDGLFA